MGRPEANGPPNSCLTRRVGNLGVANSGMYNVLTTTKGHKVLAAQDIVISGKFIDSVSFMVIGASLAILTMIYLNLRKVK